MRSCCPWNSSWKSNSCTCPWRCQLYSSHMLACFTAVWLSVVFDFFKLHLYSHLSVRQPLGGCQGWKGCNSYFMPLRSTWLAAMSMTLMMKAMAKAHIRLLRTHVCLTCCVGLEPVREKKKWWEGKKKRLPDGPLNQMLVNAWKIYDNNFWMKELIATTITWTKS